MNGTEDLLFNLFCGDAVRAARPAVLIGGADVVDILFRLRRDGLADHWLLTVSAEQEAGKQMRFVQMCIRDRIRNPYCYLDGKTVVKISFTETDTTMEDCLEHYLRGL